MTQQKKAGRPSKFHTTNLKLIKQLAEYGHTDKFIAEAIGVNIDTITEWKNKYPEFSVSLKDWKKNADEQVEKALFERAKGYDCPATKIFCDKGEIVTEEYTEHYPPDPTSMIFWLKNRRPDRWRDKQEIEHSGSVAFIENALKKVNGE